MRGWVSFEVVPTPQRPCHEPRYKRGSEWYEVGIFALKAGEAVITTLFSTFSLFQLLATMAMQVAALRLLWRAQPYVDRRTNALDALLVVATVVQLGLGLVACVAAVEGRGGGGLAARTHTRARARTHTHTRSFSAQTSRRARSGGQRRAAPRLDRPGRGHPRADRGEDWHRAGVAHGALPVERCRGGVRGRRVRGRRNGRDAGTSRQGCAD